jgi:hypothetical protein
MKVNSQPEGVPATGVENRRSVRKAATAVPSITGVRLSPVGGEAVLVNISASGVLVRCMTRLRPDTSVNVIFDGGFSPSAVPSRIVRCVVAQIDASGKLWFDLGIAFKKPIALDDAPRSIEVPLSTPPAQAPMAVAVPAVNRW